MFCIFRRTFSKQALGVVSCAVDAVLRDALVLQEQLPVLTLESGGAFLQSVHTYITIHW